MTESYLHFIWRNKRLLTPDLFLTQGSDVKILNFGKHNELLKGPDFKYGAIIYDNIEHHGHIELHVNSSDWYLHKHHLDPNYDNVVLHVVYNHDKEVFQDGYLIPTIELKDLIDQEHWQKHTKFSENKNQIICTSEISTVDPIYLESMMCKALNKKLNERVNLVKSYFGDEGSELNSFLAAAFGSNLNKLPFLELIRKLPVGLLKTLSKTQCHHLLITESGLLVSNEGSNRKLNHWHLKGTRPANFPQVRIKQFAYLVNEASLDHLSKYSTPEDVIDFFKTAFETCNNGFAKGDSILTESFQENLIINGVVPYLWYLAGVNEDSNLQSLAIDILSQLKPERNRITSKWKDADLEIKNAYHSQSLLALHRYHCCRKKCLSCEVGNDLLNKNK